MLLRLRHITFLFALLFGASLTHVQAAIYQGTCGASGDNLTWTLDTQTGVLTISGTGPMGDYTSTNKPWHNYRLCIRSVIINNGVTTIGKMAFYNCGELTSVTIPNSVNSLGNNAFNYCDKLKDIYVSWTSDIPSCDNTFLNKSIYGDFTIHVPCGTKSLYLATEYWSHYSMQIKEEMAHGTCGANVHWALSCDSIMTFSGTGPMAEECDYTELLDYFNYKIGVKKVIFGSGVTFIGIHALSQFINLEYIEVEEGNPVYDSRDNCNALVHTATNTIIFGAGKTVIPPSVRALRAWAFANIHTLTSITIPSTVESLGNELFTSDNGAGYHVEHYDKGLVFHNCTELTDIYVQWTDKDAIPKWISMTNKTPQSDITLHVPCGCKALYQALDKWKDYNIDGGASGTCGANLTWTLCDSVLTISGTGALYNWDPQMAPWYEDRKAIKSIEVVDGVTNIGTYAFYRCENMTSVSLPSSVTTIGAFSFYGCVNLPSIILPENLNSIDNYAFEWCNELSSIFIPNSVTVIGSWAFYSNGLKDIYVSWPDGSIPKWYDNMSKIDGVTLHVPCSEIEAYRTTKGWKEYSTIEGDEKYPVTVSVDDPSMGSVKIEIIEE